MRRQGGISLLEFLICMIFILPLSFFILGIVEHERLSYKLDEILENNLGNKNIFIIKIGQNHQPLAGEIEKLEDKLNDLEENARNQIVQNVDARCQINNVEFSLEQRNNDNENLMFFVDRKTGHKRQIGTIYYVVATATLDKDTCVRAGVNLFSRMGDIVSTRETLVDYEF